MRRQLIHFVCALFAPLVTASLAAAAEPLTLAGDSIKQTVTGATLALDTPLGMTVSIRFTADGLMSGEAKELATLLGAPKDRGRWWIARDQLCYKWFRWFEAEPRCLVVRQAGLRIFWERDDGENGTGTIVEPGQVQTLPQKTVVAVATSESKTTPQQIFPAPTHGSAEAPSKDAPSKDMTFITASATPLTVPNVAESAQPTLANRPRILNPDSEKLPISAREPTSLQVTNKSAVAAEIKPPKVAAPKAPAAKPETKEGTKKSKSPVQTAALEAKAGAPKASAPLNPKSAGDTILFRIVGVRDDDVLNVRTGPSEYHSAIAAISPKGRGIAITGGCLDEWCPIQHRSVKGWVNRYYLVMDGAQDVNARR